MEKNKVQRMSFIGKEICVTDAKNKSYVGLKGKIVDETKCSFIVEQESSKKTVLKNGTVFMIEGTTITGESIIGRCDQRIKR